MNRRGFLGRLAAAAAALGVSPFVSKPTAIPTLDEPPPRLSDAEVLEDGVYDGAPFFPSGSISMDARCPFRMGHGPCGYRGPVTRCDKRYGSCRCPAHFGGFPGVAIGAPVYQRTDGGASCIREKDGVFVGLCTGIEKGSKTKPTAAVVQLPGTAGFRA